MKRFLSGLLAKRSAARLDPVAVDPACFVIGDIHGCDTLLARLLDKAPKDAQLICVGDYVDRGDDSAAVLRRLHARPDITCIAGNHEAMLLKFIDAPTGNARRWLRFGGLQTLASFGISGALETRDPGLLTGFRDSLVAAMGPDLLGWLRDMPTQVCVGNVAVVHAGADPALGLADQKDSTLIWGHPDFGKTSRTDGLWVLHGHTIVGRPSCSDGIISIDTGAYATGRLTAAHLTTHGCAFVTVDQADG